MVRASPQLTVTCGATLSLIVPDIGFGWFCVFVVLNYVGEVIFGPFEVKVT
jgi:hypothetical protein